ncbi:MAG: hypothetical protein AAF184_01845 [Pseudomonadota bacterium]
MKNYIGPAALASAAFFAALGDAWADDVAGALPLEPANAVLSAAPVTDAPAWTIDDYINARQEQPAVIVLSTAEDIEAAARSL